ncbi:MAG: hypothetical protein ACWGON_11330, partial [Gemmatimonadota bacterium]
IALLEGSYREAMARFGPVLWDSTGYRIAGEALESGDATALLEYVGLAGEAPVGNVWPSVWILLGLPDQAIDRLETAIQSGGYGGLGFLWDPEPFDSPITEHPRFKQEILPLVNLEGREVQRLPPDAELPGF